MGTPTNSYQTPDKVGPGVQTTVNDNYASSIELYFNRRTDTMSNMLDHPSNVERKMRVRSTMIDVAQINLLRFGFTRHIMLCII